MNPGRPFLLLTVVALLGAIASFDEDAQASLLDGTGETARGTAQSHAVATYHAGTDKMTEADAQEQPVLTPPQTDGREGGEVPSQRMGARSNAEPPAPAGNPL